MSRPESTFVHMVLALLGCAVLSSAALAGVHVLTRERIDQAVRQSRTEALRSVLPPFDGDPLSGRVEVATSRGSLAVYPVWRDGFPAGVAVETFSLRGYSGRIDVTAGFSMDGIMTGTLVTAHRETPGLGSKLSPAESSFAEQFRGRDPALFHLQVRQDGGDVDAITAATVSSRAYCDALKGAVEAFHVYREKP